MGRTQLIAKYEITPQIKELQRLAMAVKGLGFETNIDITQDLVTFNGYRKMTYIEAKTEMLRLLESNKTALTTKDYPDPEEVAREEKARAKAQKKHREPGAPPELKQIFKRSKRIFKKTLTKTQNQATAAAKAQMYIDSKATDEDKAQATQLFLTWQVSQQ